MQGPRLLDLFCGAGGCSVGYHRSGFLPHGVDHRPQPRYPFSFTQADALAFLQEHGNAFDAIHASPPCQRYSRCASMPRRKREDYPDLVGEVRSRLEASGKLWVIENVELSPLKGIVLCGQMFGLAVYRHRVFESSVLLLQPPHTRHRHRIKDPGKGNLGGQWHTLKTKPVITVAGHTFRVQDGRLAMGIDWPMTRDELCEAIPPAYTEFIGRQLLPAVVSLLENRIVSNPFFPTVARLSP